MAFFNTKRDKDTAEELAKHLHWFESCTNVMQTPTTTTPPA